MALPVVRQCCCGCTLETGSKIIAWLQIVGGAFMLISGIVAAVGGGGASDDHHTSPGGGSSVSQLLGGILSIIFGVVLLMGIQKKRPDHINAWVIINLVGIILYIIGAIISAIALMVAGAIPAGAIVIVICAIQIALTFYFVVVVSSLRKEMVAAGNIGV